MFTGIVEEVGEIVDLNENEDGFKVSVKAQTILKDLNINDSISCSGVCLTVVEIDNNTFNVQLVNETIKRTSAKSWSQKTKVNLERSIITGIGSLPFPWLSSDGLSMIAVLLPIKIASQLERSSCTDCLEFLLVIHLDKPFDSSLYS